VSERGAESAPDADAPETLARAARAGIHRLELPTPFLVGRVNCWLIQDEPLTLVDTGPNSGSSLDALEQALAEHGVAVEDLELIVLTHHHMDHVGLLEIVARRSGAEVAAFAPLAGWLAAYPSSAADDDAYAQAVMRIHGVPEELITVLGSVAAAFRAYGSSGEVTRPLGDADRLTLRDRSFEVLHRPGHSPSDTVLFDEQRGILIAGDHLLGHISSNPVISRPLTEAGAPPGAGIETERPRPLIDYVASMRATRELPAKLVLPGHGDPITDHVGLIAERLRLHERRARKILRIIEPEPISAHDIATRMWGNVAVTQAFLTLSEVLGHADILLAAGTIVELPPQDGVIQFAAA
jgi:glyoxylase-like metal-dependent hydrolase (beta-lactamase superfamily II)